MRAKLVRDHCAAVVEAPDRDDQTVAPENSLAWKHMALLLKLHEEVDEISRAATDPEEYGDLLEAMMELAKINAVSWDDILEAMCRKREERGGFKRGMIWTVDVPSEKPKTFEEVTAGHFLPPTLDNTPPAARSVVEALEEDHIDWDKVNDLDFRSDPTPPYPVDMLGERAGFPPAVPPALKSIDLREINVMDLPPIIAEVEASPMKAWMVRQGLGDGENLKTFYTKEDAQAWVRSKALNPKDETVYSIYLHTPEGESPSPMTDRYRTRQLEEALRWCKDAAEGSPTAIRGFATSFELSKDGSCWPARDSLRVHTVLQIVKKALDRTSR